MASDVQVVTKEIPVFTRKKHELAKLLKSIQSVTEEAVEVLQAGLKDADIKERRSCAKTLIDYEVAVTKQINEDQMQRLIAEIKFGNGVTKTLSTEDKSRLPVVNFNDIIEV